MQNTSVYPSEEQCIKQTTLGSGGDGESGKSERIGGCRDHQSLILNLKIQGKSQTELEKPSDTNANRKQSISCNIISTQSTVVSETENTSS